jgi:hypothetical protein
MKGDDDLDYLLCLPAEWPVHPGLFLTNEFGRCCRCRRAIQFRPESRKTPFRICPSCLIVVLEEKMAKEPVQGLAEYLETLRVFRAAMETMAAKKRQQNGVSKP